VIILVSRDNVKRIANFKGILKRNRLQITRNVRDEDLRYLRGVHTISLSYFPISEDDSNDSVALGDIQNNVITDAGIKHLAGVHEINLGDCLKISDEGLKHIAGVHTITLADCNVTDKGM
jgi:hypothetical protein